MQLELTMSLYRMQLGHQLAYAFRRQQPARVLKLNGMDPQFHQVLRLLHEVLVGVDRADGVSHGADDV